MKIQRNSLSSIKSVDFNNIKFGEIFTDHMFVCDFENGEWNKPEILPYQAMKLDPSTSVFHYGQAIFEGMKAYKDSQGEIWLFRPDQNIERLNRSAIRLSIPEFPESYFFDGLKNLLLLDSDWIKPGIGNSLYIRPFVFASEQSIQASPSKSYKFIIICSPAKSYYIDETNVKIAEKFSRAATGGVGFAKTAGNYAAQFYPTSLAIEEGFQQIIWTDAYSHQFIEESGTMNIFVKINNTLITTPVSDRILDGITRKSILEIGNHLGIDVEVRPISVDELIYSSNNGSLQEMFGCGTAVVINPIKSFGYQNKKYQLPTIKDPISTYLKEKIISIQYNTSEDLFKWRYKVS